MGEKIRDVFVAFWDQLIALIPNLLVAIFFIFFFSFVGYLIGKGFAKGVNRQWKNAIVVTYLGKALRWVFILIGIIIALYVMGFGDAANTILTGAGISAIIVGFAFKDIAENFLAGVLLLISRPFEIGHIIEVESFRGTVRGLEMRTTHIRNVTGKDIYIPNAMIVKNVVTNYTRDGYLRLDFLLGLDIPSDTGRARQLILGFLSEQDDVLAKPAPDVLVKEVGEFTITLQVLFWVDVLRQKNTPPAYLGETIRSRCLSDVKDLLLRNGFQLPSQILEHKMYQPGHPLEVKLRTLEAGPGDTA